MSGNASIETGHFAELASAVIQQLPRDIDSTTAQGWIENRSALQSALRAALLPNTQSSINFTYPVSINYGLSLEEMIAAGRYDWKSDDIVTKHFPVKGEGVANVEIQLVHFDRVIESEEAIEELDKMGLRPAKIEELLAFGAKYPKVQREFPIVALGSVWRFAHGLRHVPYLGRSGAGRGLSLGWFEGEWVERCRFAAVSK